MVSLTGELKVGVKRRTTHAWRCPIISSITHGSVTMHAKSNYGRLLDSIGYQRGKLNHDFAEDT
jgi:hypothetical protein